MGRFVAPRPFLARLRRRSAVRAVGLARVAGPSVTAVLVLGLAAPGASAQQPVPLGAAFLVNTTTMSDQSIPSVGVDDDGDFVVAWQSSGQDGSDDGVYAQRFAVDGAALGEEFRVNTHTTNSQGSPVVGIDADGDFVVVWHSLNQEGPTSGYGVYGQRYSADGVAQGVPFRANNYSTSSQYNPSVAMDADGDFVVAWNSSGQDGSGFGVYARRYTAAGAPVGMEFLVTNTTTGNQRYPSVGVEANGDFVIAWHSDGQDGNGYGVYARRYHSSGGALGTEFRVNTYTTGAQSFPSVGVDADGDFVVAWRSAAPDGSGDGVYAQRYNASGMAQGAEFRVNTYTTQRQGSHSVGVDADGDFVVTWSSGLANEAGQDGSSIGVYAQRYSAAGMAQGGEFRVNTYTTGEQDGPSVGGDADGGFVVAWLSVGQDGDGIGVYAQRYTPNAVSAEARGAEGWRMLAAPSATATVADLLGPVWIQGFPGADYEGGQPNVLRYDESAAGELNAGYTAPAAATEAMGSGRGYLAYLYADDDLNTAGVQRGFPKILYVLYSAGAAPDGPVALPVSYTDTEDADDVDGWNLVGNPYRLSVDWDLATREDVASSAYVYDPALPGYRSWNGVAGNLPGGVVAPLQGFWVKAMDTNGSGTVVSSASIPASAQVAGGTFYGRSGEAAAPVLALRLTREAGGYGREAQAFVSFEAGAQAGLDAADAYQLDPMALDYTALFTRATDGTALAIQALPITAGSYALPLEVAALERGAAVGGAFTLAWAAPALPAGWRARLLDAATGTSVDLTTAGQYGFTLNAPENRSMAPASTAALAPPTPRVPGTTGDGLVSGRFSVVVDAATTGTEGETAATLSLTVAPNPMTGSGVVRYMLPEAGRVRVALYDVLGREVAVLHDGEQASGRHEATLDAGSLAPGAYLVRLTAGDATLVRRVTVAR